MRDTNSSIEGVYKKNKCGSRGSSDGVCESIVGSSSLHTGDNEDPVQAGTEAAGDTKAEPGKGRRQAGGLLQLHKTVIMTIIYPKKRT